MNSASEVIEKMLGLADEKQQTILSGFFKTGKGEYGEGDKFLGIKVPVTREIVKQAKDLSLDEIQTLIDSEWHEIRLCGFLILVSKYKKQPTDEILQFYVRNAKKANNWDLVDLSVYKILGQWLTNPEVKQNNKTKLMDRLANSTNLWEQRMSVVATMTPIKNGDYSYIWKYGEKALTNKHDLMHKALGWMLREMGKKDKKQLILFLEKHHDEMPRTALRYAIEKLPNEEKREWMKKKYADFAK